MHQHADKVIFVVFQSEKHAAADVVDPCLHGSVHRLGVVRVVALRPCRMKRLVRFLVVSLLEKDIRSDPRVFEHLVLFYCSRRDVHVDSSDRAVFVFDAVDRLDAFEYIFYRVVERVFAGLDRQSLVAHILQRDHFLPDVLLAEFLSRDVLVLAVVRTVNASVDAVVGKVQRREHHDPVAVEMLFYLFAECKDLLDDRRVFTFEQRHRFFV